MRRCVVLLLAGAFFTPWVHSQAPVSATNAPRVRFEVSSIRLHQLTGDDPSNRQMLPGGRFVATGTPVFTLLRIALGATENSISGAPSWTKDRVFDIDATTEGHVEVATPQQFQSLILSLLEDRFQFKFHRDKKEAPVYWLEVDKAPRLGPAIHPAAPDEKPNMSSNSNGSRSVLKAAAVSMQDIANALSRQAGRPVQDHTGLTGNYTLEIEWSSEEGTDSSVPSLFTALKEQLGLKLRPARGSTEVFVVDRVIEPDAN